MFTLSNFYKSRQWEQLIAQIRIERQDADGNVICEHCGRPIVRRYDCIGHHKVELTEDNVNDYTVSLNPANVMLIHFKCHNRIHERFDGFRQHVYLVYGAPCSGKTTYVSEIANDDDLILDVDKLWDAVCIGGAKDKPRRLKANVFGLRDCIVDQIRTRSGMWRNAFVIGGYPLRTDRDRMCDLLGAVPIYIDATIGECMERAAKDRPAAWNDYIREWFDSFVE